jgi:response regulator RpfG family c-di-GMP phosphodiesterase
MNMSKLTILVVDDDIPTLTAMRKILEKSYEVCLAKSASVAWDILNNTPVDLILLDVEMPALSGLDFMNYLRAKPAINYIPVIFVTSHGTEDIIKKAIVFGARGFVVKPVSSNMLLEKIRSVFAQAASLTERERIFKKLHSLGIACRTQKREEADRLARELKEIRYNVGTDELLSDIYKETINASYDNAVEKIDELINNNLFDLSREIR